MNWSQVNAWRLRQHCLASRLPPHDFVQAARRTGGLQAQVMSAAELACWARADGLSPQAVQSALWQEHRLVKTWAMRGALHLLAADDLSLYVAARRVSDSTRNWLYYFQYYGVDQKVYEAYLETAPHILSSDPLTREQFAAALGRQIDSPELQNLIQIKGWGTPLKPLAWRGELCFGPNQGRNVTFVRPASWIGPAQPLEPYPALQEVARRYLRTYGPAGPENFAHWWSLGLTQARKLFRSLEAELDLVEVEGWQAFALRTELQAMQAAEPSGTVNLLPLFDAYMLGLGRNRQLEPLLALAHQRLVYRPQGWISAVVLVDGYPLGTWEYETRRGQTQVRVRLFSAVTPAVRRGMEAEVERLGAFLNTRASLEEEALS